MAMLRNYMLVALLSFIVVFWSHASAQILNFIHSAFNTVSGWGAFNIGSYSMGATPRHIIALTVIPILAGLFAYFIFWLLKKEPAGFIAGLTWCVWLVLATILLIHA